MPKKPVFARSIFESIVLLDTISNSFLLSPSLLLQSSHEPGSNRIVEGRISMKRQWTDDELEAHFTLHRAAIRTFLDVHEATLADEETIVEWLCQQVLAEQRQEDALMASVYSRCKDERIEPPTPDRVRRLVHTAIHRFDEQLCASIMQRLSTETRTHLDALLTVVIAEAEER